MMAHSTSLLDVDAAVWYWFGKSHAPILSQMRSEVSLASVYSYSDAGLHTVSDWHCRLDVAVGATVCHSLELHSVKALQTLSVVAVGTVSSNSVPTTQWVVPAHSRLFDTEGATVSYCAPPVTQVVQMAQSRSAWEVGGVRS
jgi:hypothetical protein